MLQHSKLKANLPVQVQVNITTTTASADMQITAPAVQEGCVPEPAADTMTTCHNMPLPNTGPDQAAQQQNMPQQSILTAATSSARPFRRAAHQYSAPPLPLLQAAVPADLAVSAAGPSMSQANPSAQTIYSPEANEARAAALQLSVMPQPAAAAKANTPGILYHLPERLTKVPKRLLEHVRHRYGLFIPLVQHLSLEVTLTDHTLKIW